MSADPRYYYVDGQNQAAGPIDMTGLMGLRSAGTITDTTLVVMEGGTEWVALSTLIPATAAAPTGAPQPANSPASATAIPQLHVDTVGVAKVPSGASQSLGAVGPIPEPLWAAQLSQKIEELTSAMDKLVVALEKARPASLPAPVPATAALHAEKINLNPIPKPGIAAQNPLNPPGGGPRPAPLPAGVPVAQPRPGIGTPLSPLAVPANAQKSALPLPALGKTITPTPNASDPSQAKGNIFSKFLKK